MSNFGSPKISAERKMRLTETVAWLLLAAGVDGPLLHLLRPQISVILIVPLSEKLVHLMRDIVQGPLDGCVG